MEGRPCTGRVRCQASAQNSTPGEAVLKEVGQAGLVGGAVGGGLGGTFSAIHQAMRLSQGETTATEAVLITIKATASGAVRGGSVAGGSRLIAITAKEVGIAPVLGEMGPGAIANAIFEAGLSTHRFAQGEIDHEAYREELGGAALRAVSTYCGMAGQLLIPVPVWEPLLDAATSQRLFGRIWGAWPENNNIVTIAEERQTAIEQVCGSHFEMRRCRRELRGLEASFGEGLFKRSARCSMSSTTSTGLDGNSLDRLVRIRCPRSCPAVAQH